MAVLSIVKYPHPALRKPCAAVGEINEDIVKLAEDMRETMIQARGVGLAAPQVGRSLRLLVADVSDERTEGVCLANPQIIDQQQEEETAEEGCLSVPGVTAPVRRAQYVVVRGLDMQGETRQIEARALLAVCLQHEIDHLNGVLFFDHLSRLKRARLLAKYKKNSERNSDKGGA